MTDSTAVWWAYIAVELAGAIQKRLALMHCATCPKLLSARAVVDVVGRVISKVAARESAIIPLRFIEHRGARCLSPRPYLASIEKLRKDAAECALIRDLATDQTKRETYDRLSQHFLRLADEVQRTLNASKAS